MTPRFSGVKKKTLQSVEKQYFITKKLKTMPETTAATAAAWNTAGNLAATSINSMAQNNLNKATMKYNSEWAYRQREWAMQDWQMQNDYNTPANQRKRMIAAGMNPALMYGSGSTNQPSATVKSSPSPSWSPKAPEINFGASNSIMTFLGVRMQEAQLKNMEIQNRLLEERITNTQANTQLTWNKSALTSKENEKLESWLQGMRDINENSFGTNHFGKQLNYQGSVMMNELQKQSADVIFRLDSNQRQEVLNAASVDVLVARLGQIAQQNAQSKAHVSQIQENIKLLQKSGILQQFKINGEEFLNSKFSDPAAKGLLMLLKNALD